MRARTLQSISQASQNHNGLVGNVPRLAQSDISGSIFVAKRELDITVGFEAAAVQADILLESFEYESSLIV